MLIVGSDDGLYRVTGIDGPGPVDVTKERDAGRAWRVRTFDGLPGAFAATDTGLYHSTDGRAWTDLDVPQERVYAVGASPDGTLYAGTRPAHVYAASPDDEGLSDGRLDWRELDGFQELPSRDGWRLPRHDDVAQVRDLHVHPAAPDRVVAGVEVGAVHVSRDGGETWTERRDGIDDDVHELHLVGPEEFVAATGHGLFRSTDAGRSWMRLDGGYDQRYFRAVASHDGVIYAAGALANSSTWNDADADPALFACRDGESLDPVDHPRPDETVTGLTVVEGVVVAGTHGGTLLVGGDDGWSVAGSVPVPGEVTGRYTPLTWLNR
ncbi:WD40/YVTN/BNR-like repeat-containing protein [Halomicrobium salinisoli]|uniref:WD40/YVTN/BNR-like repeat-containing protein n=1 Tax=Halomicrobium salinisoli TaxID=2878391 RepID=UPI001CF04436|nr:WD40 repeat domain-containing protein [Halomicrobium salinisoli]